MATVTFGNAILTNLFVTDIFENVNSFQATRLFLYPLKTLENL